MRATTFVPFAVSKNSKIDPVESCERNAFNDRRRDYRQQQQDEGDEEQDRERSCRAKHLVGSLLYTFMPSTHICFHSLGELPFQLYSVVDSRYSRGGAGVQRFSSRILAWWKFNAAQGDLLATLSISRRLAQGPTLAWISERFPCTAAD